MTNTEKAQVFTGDGVTAFRLHSLKHQLRLEEIGMKSSGGALRPRIAKEFGLKPTDTRTKFIEVIDEKIKALKVKMDIETPTDEV